MLRGEQYYYNDTEELYYETELRSYSSSSTSSPYGEYRITERIDEDEYRYTERSGNYRALESSSSSSSSFSVSSSSTSVPFRYQDTPGDCPFDSGSGGSGSGSGSDGGPLIGLGNRGTKPLKKLVSNTS
jgi:hypothetical protein